MDQNAPSLRPLRPESFFAKGVEGTREGFPNDPPPIGVHGSSGVNLRFYFPASIVGAFLAVCAVIPNQEACSEEAKPVTEDRVWSSTSGTQISGRLFYHKGNNVVVVGADKKPYSLTTDLLKANDLEYLAAWRGAAKHWRYVEDLKNKDSENRKVLAILPASDSPVHLDSEGNLKEPFRILYAVIEKDPSVIRRAPKWSVTQSFTVDFSASPAARSRGLVESTKSVDSPIKELVGAIELSPSIFKFAIDGQPLPIPSKEGRMRISGGGEKVSVICDIEIDVIVD